MPRIAPCVLLLSVALLGPVACGTIPAAPMAPPGAGTPPASPIPDPRPDVDRDGADDAIEALEETYEKEKRTPWHRFVVTGSVMFAGNFDTTIRVDSKKLGTGTEVRLEDLLGLDESMTLLRFDATWRINRANLLGVSWFDIDRSGDQRLTRNLKIGDEVFPAGAKAHSELDTQIFKINYWWNFAKGEDWEVGAGIGLYWMRIDASFAGRVAVGGKGEVDESVDETVKVNFPPPLLGLRGAYAFTDRLRGTGSLEVLYVPINEFRGWILDFRLGLEWDVLDFAGLGLGYNFFNLGVDADLSGFEGTFDYRYHALLGSIYVYF